MLLIKNANLYGEKVEDILIAGGKIEAIGKIDLGNIDAEVYNADGNIVIPALIDQHVHVIGGGGEGGMTTRCPELDVDDVIDAGVSTIVGLLGTDSITRNIEALAAKTISLKEYGFSAYFLTGAYAVPSINLTGSVDRDIAFLNECIGVKLALNDHRCSHPTYDEILRLGSEARFGGLIGKKAGYVHIHMGNGKHGLKTIFEIIENENIPASVFRPTHLAGHFEEAIKLSRMGTYIDFTTTSDTNKTAGIVYKAIELARNESVTMSSDSNGSMPKWNENREIIGMDIGRMKTLYDTFVALVKEYHMPIREAIKPCTDNVSKALNLYPKQGTLTKGAYADILILDNELKIKEFYLKGSKVKSNYNNIMKINFKN